MSFCRTAQEQTQLYSENLRSFAPLENEPEWTGVEPASARNSAEFLNAPCFTTPPPRTRLARVISRNGVPPNPALSMLLPVGFCAPTCIPLVNCPAIGIGNFAFKNSNRECQSHEGDKLSAQKLQGTYLAALSRIAGATLCEDAKRHTPIFQRGPAVGEQQAIRDAANALAALWKIREPIKRAPSIKIQSKAGEP